MAYVPMYVKDSVVTVASDGRTEQGMICGLANYLRNSAHVCRGGGVQNSMTSSEFMGWLCEVWHCVLSVYWQKVVPVVPCVILLKAWTCFLHMYPTNE